MKMSANTIDNPKIVSRQEWLTARKKLLAKEKQLTRQRDALAAERRQLPWVKVDKNYVFDSPGGRKTLADLFDGRSQLIIYHFMFGPEWNEGCPSCSFNMDHTDGALVHLAQRDVSFAAVSRAPLSKIEPFKKRMGWRFAWVSSHGTEFNYDYHASFTQATCSTRIPRTLAGVKTPSIRITTSTMFPKAAMKIACPSRCHGSAIMIAMRTATWPTRISHTGRRKLHPHVNVFEFSSIRLMAWRCRDDASQSRNEEFS
jgi:Bacterial protein of unknown function (DUF899)